MEAARWTPELERRNLVDRAKAARDRLLDIRPARPEDRKALMNIAEVIDEVIRTVGRWRL